ncbi:RNA polymerase sigma factor [Wenyingzhuangia sp. 2_MG-2023]|uniref:RNA polymerase sigma factor n=1 Tax=Wenyingzhuangia sp. 2_MG-2023 TaxID=3062639 RepID=UPI0026E44AA2|nr:sigma-70 family RNA polymerase sigma factor [Wenyingzhuangia sp. 2_MG-2023]MDO6738883.1 sigma-70 family RNA polymerase sigma factor [Wenyingzhuangia sp. 2_MG-2023]MDO6803625.1 sigma-70 family RNA polymerase sigma factor [Wenyingzhuangia sp. 1_MG-2023]
MKSDQLLTDNILAAKKGDQTAYRYLLNLYWNDVYYFLQSKISDDSIDAEDITIITFSKAFDKINSYKETFGFKTWLFTIAKNLLIDELRKQKNVTVSIEQENKKLYNLSDENPTPEDKIIIEQNLAQLKKNIKRLKPKYQEVINLRYFQDLSYTEIAKELNEPINNVKVKLLRAKKLLAEIITNYKHED